MVYVLNKNGRPLMPTEDHRMIRLLLKENKAKAVKRTPFTIKLNVTVQHYTQPIILGVDAGSKSVGLSATTETEELFTAEVTLRNDVVEKLSTRREFRRARRKRKTRHRKPRFNNRVHSKHKGWLAPSVEVKTQEHITAVKRVCQFLPVTKVVVETAEFDLQLLKAMAEGKPAPVGTDYQQGEMLGHYNARQYVLWRDGYTCQCCGAHGAGVKFHVHHKESRKTGGEAPNNLITLCSECHERLHKGLIVLPKLKKRSLPSMRDAAFMGIMRPTLLARLSAELTVPVVETKGYITKYTRTELLKLDKSRVNDALAIALGYHGFGIKAVHTVSRTDRTYLVKPVRHHNRQLHRATVLKGSIRKNNQAPTYVKGFRLFDKVRYNGIECFVWARRSTGYFVLRMLDGKMVKDGVSYKKLTLVERSSNYLIA